jgi:plasmid stabilization system protein ParE
VGRPFMTGRINLTPEAERQLNEIDDWIAKNATAEIARRFVSAILEHIDGILVFPLGGRARRCATRDADDDVQEADARCL